MTELDRLASQLKLSKELKESAAYIYRKVMHLAKGRSIEGVVIALIYTAYKLNNSSIILDNLLQFVSVEKKQISKLHKTILNMLKIKSKTISPIIYIPKLRDKLNLSMQTQKKAIEILNVAIMSGLHIGKVSIGLAGAALYLAAKKEGEKRIQKEVSVATGISETTIRKNYKEFSKSIHH